ncbi:LGFP repeat-containing protein [Dietzia alimentaria]|uniref:LGFP repeat-containing protein n=1 Tax=Dietzia alimentaria TaxID=665550 RepID=UPI00029A7929|nr:large surface protein A [Dietzia alimentaria]
MSRRSFLVLALPIVTACALVMGGCGEQVPGGMPEAGSEPTLATENGSTGDAAAGDAGTDGAAEGDPADPIVVKIGEEEFATNMAIYRRYNDAKDTPLALQAPLASAEEIVGGTKQDYTAGTVYWSPETGAWIVRGQIHATYLDNGGPAGALGWPVGDETVDGEVILSDFQNGQIRLENQAIRVVEYPR